MSYTELGPLNDGGKTYDHLITEGEKALGPNHKSAQDALFNIGGVYEQVGKWR
jgi:hypothetical protein